MRESRSERVVPFLMVLALVVALAITVAHQSSFDMTPTAVAALPTTTTTVPPTTTTTAPPPPTTAAPAAAPARPPAPLVMPTFQVPASTWLAAADGDIPKFDAPGGHQIGTVGVYFGFVITMPVLAQQGSWLLVRTPERPNGSTAWVQASDVKLSQTPYRLVLWRGGHRLLLFDAGALVLSMPAGVGKSSTPTPLGSFFIAGVEQPGPVGYGPVVLDTSAHSEAIQSWEGEGDAVIAIHGPITAAADRAIGSSGTAISNGCVRLHPADQLKLAGIQPGTPFDVVA